MNKAQLRDACIAFSKRQDITSIFDTLFAFAQADVNRIMRTVSMEATQSGVVSGESLGHPERMIEVIAIVVDKNQLEMVSFSELEYRKENGSFRPCYTTLGDLFQLYRCDGKPYRVDFYQAFPAMMLDGDTNALMTSDPHLYMYAVLRHFADWSLDVQMQQMYSSKFSEVATVINSRENMKRIGKARVSINGVR